MRAPTKIDATISVACYFSRACTTASCALTVKYTTASSASSAIYIYIYIPAVECSSSVHPKMTFGAARVPLKVAASASPAAYVEEALRSRKEAATFEADVKTASCSIRSPRCLPWPNGSLTFTGASTALRICHRVVVTCDSCKL